MPARGLVDFRMMVIPVSRRASAAHRTGRSRGVSRRRRAAAASNAQI